ncbi:PPR containing plant-like protein [Medicago truncatula]|uniref:PPR containing plant-like protein n=2 Tax=Medicago truncatula TaxID=3880 RepID=G7KG32_MEDTR|nr:PPR containing plant-like protein [Medicago truncatula]
MKPKPHHFHLHHNLVSFSSKPHYKNHDILYTISESINTIHNNNPNPDYSLNPTLKRILPSLTSHHITNLINLNPLSLPPLSLFSFFNYLASRPPFRHTLHNYSTMAHFLSSHNLLSQTHSLFLFIISKMGHHSSTSLISSLIQTVPTHHRHNHSVLVFDALIIAYTDSEFIEDAIQCLRLVKKNNFSIPVCGCDYLLRRVMKLNQQPGHCWEFYLEVLDYGYPPNVYLFNILMHGFCKIGDVMNARMVFDEISRRGLRPSVVSFNTLISGYCRSKNVEEGFVLKSVMESERISPDVFTYSALINGLCKESRVEEANGLFDEMCEMGLVPNGVTFTTLIDGQCKHGKIDLALRNFEIMKDRGIRPDLITYNALINGLCRDGDLKEARKLLNEMIGNGFKPDKITFTTLMDGCCKDGDMDSALEIKDRMVEEGIELDDVAFTALISGLCRDGRVRDAERMLKDMLSAGHKPDDPTYTMVIDCFCKKGDVKMGAKLLKEMQRDGRVPGVVTYNALMNGFCKQGQMKNAKMLLHAMLNMEVVPNDITFNILLDGHCKHGSSVDFKIFNGEKGLVSDYASYTALVNESIKISKDQLKSVLECPTHIGIQYRQNTDMCSCIQSLQFSQIFTEFLRVGVVLSVCISIPYERRYFGCYSQCQKPELSDRLQIPYERRYFGCYSQCQKPELSNLLLYQSFQIPISFPNIRFLTGFGRDTCLFKDKIYVDVKWNFPEVDWVSHCTDDSFPRPTQIAGCGGSTRSEHGVWVCGFSRKVKKLLKHVIKISEGDWIVRIKYVFGKANKCADFLANLSSFYFGGA